LAKLVYKREEKKRRKKLLDEFLVQPTKFPSEGSLLVWSSFLVPAF
jgi:hypothetical protein